MSVIEHLKRMNLVEFLERSYGIVFGREGDAHVALSPFREESRPSFCVREERDGHWVFKDHGSGQGGTVFDFVMLREGLGSFSEALGWLCRMTGLTPEPADGGCGAVPSAVALPGATGSGWKKKEPQSEDRQSGKRYDVAGLYEKLRGEDASVCGEYLLGRGIDQSLVAELLDSGTVVLNRFERGTFCCFAVRDAAGTISCLYNRQIDGDGKFVLGRKAPFSLDWAVLPQAETVFLCEGPLDYLSVKTLEGRGLAGLALLGNVLNVTAAMLPSCRKLITAFDGDHGGFSALYDALEKFSDRCEVHVYELEDCKDPNELLVARRHGQARELSPEQKLQLYREFTAGANKADVVRKWQLSRSYVYAVVRECEALIVAEFASRHRGRPRNDESADLAAARKRIEELEDRYEIEATEREKLHCRSEFLALRLKWAEIEAAEARGEKVDPQGPAPQKRQAKKKEKEETVMLLDRMILKCARLSATAVSGQCGFSRERLHCWRQAVTERKVREQKLLPEQTVENTAAVVACFPHLGGRKAQAYMAYHELGAIGQKAFDALRHNVKRVLVQELSGRPDCARVQEHYEHVRPAAPGEVWAEDFTELPVAGVVFKLATVVDVFDHYFLGWADSPRATATFVGKPVEAALEANHGSGPEQFLLSDHGTQYMSETHEQQLSSADIVHRLIPACTPQYNGTAESEMRTVKSVFYNVWERGERQGACLGDARRQADGKEKPLPERVTAALSETFRILNDQMPRPFLGGVTPADVHFGRAETVRDRIRSGTPLPGEAQVQPWKRKYWDVINDGVKSADMSTRELQTKLAFFGLRPLRRIAKLNQEVSGNFHAVLV